MPRSGRNSDLAVPGNQLRVSKGESQPNSRLLQRRETHRNCNPGQRRLRGLCNEEGESNKSQKQWKEPCCEGAAQGELQPRKLTSELKPKLLVKMQSAREI